ncbi:hypothetical protein VPNG_01099 [Cytospora leucostoma]|uniref:Peptidase M12A domain-containing protein n=1 Tax=Cytospora leucostoma TaxID=1230097 RepID=A0A423XKT1_9PEZI|nr:hypothetical protein VPNG_01099 [Cytospora leucostoma]
MQRLALPFLCLFSLVLAGSRHWQPPLTRRGRDSSEQPKRLGRREFVMETSSDGLVIWPNRQIRYCYENAAAKEALNTDVLDAWQIWLTHGLSESFTIKEVDEAVCVSDRWNTLLIADTTSETNPSLSSTVGFFGPENNLRGKGPDDSLGPRVARPRMLLTTNTDLGMLNAAFNIAHEWGHAWGLYHEHQNPNFWGNVAMSNDGLVFGPDNTVTYNGASVSNWMCENLKGFSEDMLVPQKKTSGIWTGCSSWGVAVDRKFAGALEYLPTERNKATGSTGHTKDSVDWESIMLYNSKSGGTGTVTSKDDDERLPILLQPDGSLIPFNYAPSIQDIDALETLYGLKATTEVLLQKAGGDTTSRFKSIFNKSKGGSSTSGCL